MYHTRQATKLLDKVYALLGMSSDDDLDIRGLMPDYKASWKDLFRKLVKFCLSDQATVSTWDDKEVAVIETKGYVLGKVSSEGATQDDGQHVEVTWKNAPGLHSPKQKQSFTFQALAKAVKEGDVVCLLQGALRPTIIRPYDDFATIIMIAFPLTDDLPKWLTSTTAFPTELLLAWDWDESQERLQDGGDFEDFIRSRGVPECPRTECQCRDGHDRATRLWNLGLLLNSTDRYEEAGKRLRKAVARRGKSNNYSGHGPQREADEKALTIMDDLRIDGKGGAIEAKYKEHGHTPLRWAAEEGLEAFMQLLIDNGADVDAEDENNGWTPLSWAAGNGHETVVRLLLDNGANIEGGHSGVQRHSSSWTPLCCAAMSGYKAVVRLLLDKGANIEGRDSCGRTPLCCAAESGYKAVVRLLLDKGANIEGRDSCGQTPLCYAAESGHEAVVRLLLNKGANFEGRDSSDRTPLSRAAQSGHEAVVRLLLNKGANFEARDICSRTPLSRAAQSGHEAVVRLLLNKGAGFEASDISDRTPLSWAAESGHEAVVRLLLDKGADIEASDRDGRTPLSWAAESGHEAVVELLKAHDVELL